MNDSKVEVTGFEARHYDLLMNIITLGIYPKFIRTAIEKMNIQPSDRILDLGCGTGRNSSLMANYLSVDGSILGLDIGPEMIEQFNEKCRRYLNVEIQNLRIDEPLPFKREFDKVFIAFVLHGFPDEKRKLIIDNVKNALKIGGKLFVLDYNEFDLNQRAFGIRWVFENIECPLASDFIKKDWKARLSEWGFYHFEENLFFRKTVRLLHAELKPE